MTTAHMQGKLLRVNVEGNMLVQMAKLPKFRYYRLEGCMLKQYRSEKEKEPLRQIQLDKGSTVYLLPVDDLSSPKDPATSIFFRILFPNTSKLDFQSSTQNDCLRWVEAIKACLDISSLNILRQPLEPEGETEADGLFDISQDDSLEKYSASTPDLPTKEEQIKSRWSVQHGGAKILRIIPDRYRCAAGSEAFDDFKVSTLGISFIPAESGYLQVTNIDSDTTNASKINVGDLILSVNGRDVDSDNWEQSLDDIVGSSPVDVMVGPRGDSVNDRRAVKLFRKADMRAFESRSPSSRKFLDKVETCSTYWSETPPQETDPVFNQGEISFNTMQRRNCGDEMSDSHSGLQGFKEGVPLQQMLSKSDDDNQVAIQSNIYIDRSISSSRNLVLTVPKRNSSLTSTATACMLQAFNSVATKNGQEETAENFNGRWQIKNEHPSVSRSEVIELNIGGRLFMTTWSTICRAPNSMLAQIVEGKVTVPLDTQGTLFIDRDPVLFEPILEYLRHGIIQKHDNTEELNRAILEAKDYGIFKLCDALERQNNMLCKNNTIEGTNKDMQNAVLNLESSTDHALSRSSTVEKESLILHNEHLPKNAEVIGMPENRKEHVIGQENAVKILALPSTLLALPNLSVGKRVEFDGSIADQVVIKDNQKGMNGADRCEKSSKSETANNSSTNSSDVREYSQIKPILKSRNGGITPRNHTDVETSEQPSNRPDFCDDCKNQQSRKVLLDEMNILSCLLSRFYDSHGPNEAFRVASIVQDFGLRGGGKYEFEFLNDCLRKKYGSDLGQYELNFKSIRSPASCLSGQSVELHEKCTTRVVKLTRSMFDGKSPRLGLLLEPVGSLKEIEIVALAPGSPAFQSGKIHIGDRIRSINGTMVYGMSLQTVTTMLAGVVGSTVTLEVERARAADDSVLNCKASSLTDNRTIVVPEAVNSSALSSRKSADFVRIDPKAKYVAVEIIAARNFPAELKSLALYCTAEIPTARSPDSIKASISRKFPFLNPRTKAIVCEGADQEIIYWKTTHTLEFWTKEDQIIVRLWAKIQGNASKMCEPMHAGYALVPMTKIIQENPTTATWHALTTLDGRHIVRAPEEPLELQLSFTLRQD